MTIENIPYGNYEQKIIAEFITAERRTRSMGEPPVANSNGSAQSESQHSPGRKKPRPRRRLFHEVSLPGLASYNNLIGPLSPHESWATAPALQLTYRT